MLAIQYSDSGLASRDLDIPENQINIDLDESSMKVR